MNPRLTRRRRNWALAIASVAACCAASLFLACRESDRVRVAVWQYQIASHSGLVAGQVCVGIRDATPEIRTTFADPSMATIGALGAIGARVVPISLCSDSAVTLILGHVTYRSPWEATVEGSDPYGGYRYHVMRSQGAWRVRGADMTWIN